MKKPIWLLLVCAALAAAAVVVWAARPSQPKPCQEYAARVGIAGQGHVLLVPAQGCAGCVQECCLALRLGQHTLPVWLVAEHPTHTDDFEAVYGLPLARFAGIDSLRLFKPYLGSVYYPTLLNLATCSQTRFTADSGRFALWLARHAHP
jgi:hypothetical protein